MRNPLCRSRLMHGASVLCLAVLGATSAHGQSASALRRGLGIPDLPANAVPRPGVVTYLPSVTLVRDQASAAARQAIIQQRLANSLGMVSQAQTAARAAAAALAQTVPNGLATGGLQLVANPLAAARDASGLSTLQNALAPTQSVTNGQTTVTVKQTDARAILSWTTFNVGRDTTLVFDQSVNGVAQPSWVAFNRVVGQYDPATGRRDPTLAPAPSQILGHITAPGTVIVINANGVEFSGTAQVNAGSLLVSTLEFGANQALGAPQTIAGRNSAFLNLGVLGNVQSGGGLFQSAGIAGPATVTAETPVEGAITIAAGADLSVGDAGTLLLAAPFIANAGSLSASNGAVLLGAGRSVFFGVSTGAAGTGASDADIRGLFLTGALIPPGAADVGENILNTGSISSVRGYIGLRSDAGAVLQQGVVQATTSVSRNGFIDIFAPDVLLGPGSTIAITPDSNGETIPQAPDSVAAFKTSRVRIGTGAGTSRVDIMGGSLLYAPGARVALGGTGAGSRVFVDSGATIDASGIKDVALPATHNQVIISPAKRNELRDTPNYRDSFLNGATLYLDARRTGVRADGTTWVGSPLVEAESYFQQIGVTAAELLTRGGSVTMAASADVIVKPGAAIDVSGGWVRYAAGQIQTSQLITSGGQVVDIGDADPNGSYVGLVNPFTTTNSRFGITDKFPNATFQGVAQVASYTEGRDAGALVIASPTVVLDGTVYGAAYAGSLQRAQAVLGTGTATLPGDARRLQGLPSQLPAGALLAINPVVATAIAGNIKIAPASAIALVPATLSFGQTVSLDANGVLLRPAMRDPASLLSADRAQTIGLADSAITGMDLGQLTLNTIGSLTITAGTVITLAPGGIFSATLGLGAQIDGALYAPGGSIAIGTSSAPQLLKTGTTLGSIFAPVVPVAGTFDVVINGTLSTAGRFVNDFGLAPEQADGGGYTAGGSIAITAAPRIATLVGAPANSAIDISGSILINPGALLDVSGGAVIASSGVLATGARGGDLSLTDATTYVETTLAYNTDLGPPGSVRGLRFSLTPPQPPIAAGINGVAPDQYIPVNPGSITARVTIAPGSVRAAGFAGGGAFNLVTPAFAFADTPATVGTALPLNFLQQAGFASATIQTLKTSLTPGGFVDSSGRNLGGFNALLATDTITIAQGQTLDLTQARFSPFLTSDQTTALRAMPTRGSLYSVLTPAVDVNPYDRLPIALAFGGLVELDVNNGARVTGAAGAALGASKILDEGMIRLPGGSVTATEQLPYFYVDNSQANGAIGLASLGAAFTTQANGTVLETAPNALGVRDASGQVVSNRDLALSHALYLLGRLGQGEGLRVATGALLDVSGVSLINPRAVSATGVPVRDGRLIGGGTVQSSAPATVAASVYGAPAAIGGQALNALPGSTISIAGAADSYARFDSTGTLVPTPQWSDAGSLVIGAGGTIAGANVIAAGGAPNATGGTFDVRNLVLSQADPQAAGTGAISASQIAASGFDTVVSEGSLNTVGDVSLSLRRAFIVQSVPYDGSSLPAPDAFFGVTIGATGKLAITAPIIRFASIAQGVPDITLGVAGTGSATFTANALDVQGAVLFSRALASTTLVSATDLRLIGVQPALTTIGLGASVAASLQGQLASAGDLTLAAGQVYATTGSTFAVTSAAAEGMITIQGTGAPPATPYSAGSILTVQAANIEQAGVLRAPLGTLTLGANTPLLSATGQQLSPATASLHLAAGSTTSVSADGLSIPYGITTDQVEYFFTPTTPNALTAPPVAILRLGGGAIALDKGATIDLKGGGDVYAYEFIPGVGGSRDVLSRFNSDPFSSKTGFQYADGRQVYAIVPGLQNVGLAPIDPILSADYGALYGVSQIGREVYLNAAPGLAAGFYTLLPAQYALLPGGLRVVEQPEYGVPIPGRSTVLKDGTILTAGYFGTAGTALSQSTLRTFSVQPPTTFRNASQIATTSADATFPAVAARNGLASPRVPIDAGRLVLSAITSITADATFQTDAAPGGRASTTDISGTSFEIVGNAPANPAPGTIVLTAGTLQALNSASLLIGGTRTDNLDGTTSLAIGAQSILVDSGASLSAPELLFAVDGSGSVLRFADGSSMSATGLIGDTRTGDYLIAGGMAQTGAGAFARFSTGPERLVTRSNVASVGVTPLLEVGEQPMAATMPPPKLSGNAVLLDSSGDLRIASPATGTANIAANALAIGAGAIGFSATPLASGLTITPQIQAAFASAQSLNLRSRQSVSFAPGVYGFGALTIDTPLLGLIGSGGAVTLNTATLRLANGSAQALACTPACGTGTLAINATSLSFGSGQIRASGFGGGVTLAAPGGTTFDGADNTNTAANNGVAGFDTGTAPLLLATPFLGDRALALQPGQSAVLPRFVLATTGTLTLTGGAGTAPTVAGTPGAELSLSGSDVSITDTHVVATAGLLTVAATGALTLAGTAELSTPGYSRQFGDAADPVTQSAPGGLLKLSAGGDITLGTGTTLSVGGGKGNSGELDIVAANGVVSAAGMIDAKTPGSGGVFSLLTRGAFDFGHFADASAAGFDRMIAVRTGAGDLTLGGKQTLTVADVRLTADGGLVDVVGTIDASGVNGGNVALYGGTGVTLWGQLLARARGYGANDSRQASGGAVNIGTDGAGAITLEAGSIIDVSATRPGDRLVADVRAGKTYYRLALGDQGGTVAIRAPIIEAAAGDSVNVMAAGTVTGSREVSVEGFKRFDLGAAAGAGFTGVQIVDGVAVLDPSASGNNLLSGSGANGIVGFVQGFNLTGSAATLAGLGTYAARPGVELDSAGGIRLAANWNLGAGSFDPKQIPTAIAAGDIARDLADPTQIYVVPGREADFFQHFVHLTYRVGGKVDGEPGVLTIRAGGTLDIAANLTDGFFTFRNQTAQPAIDYAYGGGARVLQPAVQADCANAVCPAGVFDAAQTYNSGTAITIGFAALDTGAGVVVPPAYDAAANLASPVGGDPLGTAELFPRLSTATGTRAVGSWSYTLIGGADLTARGGAPSADPRAVLPTATTANVIVRGETSYTVDANAGPQVYGGPLVADSFALSSGFATGTSVSLDQFASTFASNQSVDPNAPTLLTLAGPGGPGDAIGQLLNSRAASFFAPGQAVFGSDASHNPTVATSLTLAGAFLQSIASDLGALIAAPASGYAALPQSSPNSPGITNFVRTRVRTGTGSIALAAAGSIDTTGGAAILRTTGANINLPVQVGGTAIYTAGALADLGARTLARTGSTVYVDPSAYLAASIFASTDPLQFQPVADALPANLVYASGGGAVSLSAGLDVLGRRDVAGSYRQGAFDTAVSYLGAPDQPYRVGQIDAVTSIAFNPQLFQTGIATLGGGAVTVRAGRDLVDLSVLANTSVTTADVTGANAQPTRALITVGGGDVQLSAGRDVASGRFDVGAGTLTLVAARDLTSTGPLILDPTPAFPTASSNGVRVRVADATATLTVGGQASVRDVSALGVGVALNQGTLNVPQLNENARNFYTPASGFAVSANGQFTLEDYGSELLYSGSAQSVGAGRAIPQAVLPGSFSATSLTGDLQLARGLSGRADSFQLWLTPSPIGQLALFAGGNLRPVGITMDDGDPGFLPGYFSTFAADATTGLARPGSRLFGFSATLSTTSDAQRRLYHNSTPTHLGDAEPVRIVALGDIQTLRLATPKQTRIGAGRDLLNAAVFAQNLIAGDISRVTAGRDIIGTTTVGQTYGQQANGSFGFGGPSLPITLGNVFVIGGPGTLFVEAGRDAGPFLTSVTATAFQGQGSETLGGGILSVGNDYNPWLQPVGANVNVQFGVAKGVNYDGLRDTYVDPANVANLPDELFVQNRDQFDRLVADRTRPIYAPVLIEWVQANAAAQLIAAYGTSDVTVAQAYAVFKALPELNQRQLLVEQVYFNELKQASIPSSVSYLKYSRGYRAVNLLFPASFGYTANNLSGGGNTGTVPVAAGNLDLRLATIQTTRGGNIDILGPGGRVLGGSTVRTSAQAARRLTIAERVYDGLVLPATSGTPIGPAPTAITTIPTGLEGVLTLRGGAIDGFVDTSFLLNQSRLFTEAGGDVELWSSNGDLNAGQGPKTSANFPPIVVRVGPNGNAEVDAAGAVSGAGIAAFQPAPGLPAPNVYLIAPRGTVDAGDAGVRVAGNLFVAALSVANADNFAVGGQAFGVPSGPVVNAGAANAANGSTAAAAQAVQAAASATNRRQVDPLSRIVVDVLGYYGEDPCNAQPRPANCPVPR